MADKVLRKSTVDVDPEETREWIESLDYALENHGPDRVRFLLNKLEEWTYKVGVEIPFSANTPYINTIPENQQIPYPGERQTERRIKSLNRWNAMAMVVRANRHVDGIGGHISSYASSATLLEVAFGHFLKGKGREFSGDQIYFQGHASPGVYARAFLEGRLSKAQLENFRRELKGGLSSYPHPWLMPDFWEFPTVSMGLAPIMGIYQARFNRYLKDRGLKDTSGSRTWVFMGDGEADEPESLGAITLASREQLENLIFVINCNLQRLDGPVRGNGKIIQELETIFRGAGWNVIKVIWGDDWDPLLAKDENGLLMRRMDEVVDGQYQRYSAESGDYIRRDFFGVHPELLKMVEHLSDEQLQKMRRGGHDPEKVYTAYKAAVEHKGSPTVILAKTIKGYGLGEAGEGRNVTHQQKKLNEDELREFRTRFSIPISDEEVAQAPFYRPPENSPEMRYMKKRREELGGYVPIRQVRARPLKAPSIELFREFLKGTGDREASTTMAFARMFSQLLRDPEIGKWIVPIIPDEARTFGMEPLFRQCGIYSSVGQVYEPVDADTLLYYREAKDGQILEEGITEAGAMSSFMAAGNAYATHGVNTIPFFIYYSMFGFQRIGDLVWAAADMRCKGFMLGGTAGRTTLNGEGLQHEDGHSHVLASTVPNLVTYDPAFAYEIATILQDGIRRMYQEQEDIFYYLTLGNELYPMPAIPEDAMEGILKGIYRLNAGQQKKGSHHVQLFGSGSILRETLRAQEILADRFDVTADVWSVTSYKELRREAIETQRWNMLHPTRRPRKPYIAKRLEKADGPVVAASDYLKLLPDMIRPWVPQEMVALGTDGFGRSDTREGLRRHFEVDAECIAVAALYALAQERKVDHALVEKAIQDLEIDPDKVDPVAAGPVVA